MAGITRASTAPAVLPTRAHQRSARLRRALKTILPHLLLAALAVLFLVPFFWMLISSLKTKETMFTYPIEWLPRVWNWQNYPTAINYPNFPFLRFLWNSTYYSLSVTVGTALSCAMVGYAFARLRFPLRTPLFYVTIATLMIPWMVTFIPTFILFKELDTVTNRFLGIKMLGTYLPLIIPAFGGNAFYIFMMRQFFMGLPSELSDAARVDGAGEFRIFWQIMLPLVKPALMVMAVFTFLGTWHDFFGPLIYVSDNRQYPLSLGLYAFRAQRTTEWALMMAAATLATLPLMVIFFFTQRYFLEGIKLTGLKG
jgi:multiple sugar transport system permease protein